MRIDDKVALAHDASTKRQPCSNVLKNGGGKTPAQNERVWHRISGSVLTRLLPGASCLQAVLDSGAGSILRFMPETPASPESAATLAVSC